MGVPVRLHKLIYKFTDDLNDIVHDVQLAEKAARGQAMDKNVLGTASILEVFMVSVGKSGNKMPIFGSKATIGELHSKNLYQVKRSGQILADGLTLSDLKHHKKKVSTIEKDQECGVSFN